MALFPPLPLATWRTTRDSLHICTQLMGRIRGALTPKQRHREHTSLSTTALGLTTTPMPLRLPTSTRLFTFELRLELLANALVLNTSRGEVWQRPLYDLSATQIYDETVAILNEIGIYPDIDHTLFSDNNSKNYDAEDSERFWQILSQIDMIFKRFRSELSEKTSPVQFWPQHFDLAVTWFSGRIMPGVDSNHSDKAEEMLNFGFSTGDNNISEPYFYVTAHPLPANFLGTTLPTDAFWYNGEFQGAIMKYDVLTTAADPQEKLLHFLRTLQKIGASSMK